MVRLKADTTSWPLTVLKLAGDYRDRSACRSVRRRRLLSLTSRTRTRSRRARAVLLRHGGCENYRAGEGSKMFFNKRQLYIAAGLLGALEVGFVIVRTLAY